MSTGHLKSFRFAKAVVQQEGLRSFSSCLPGMMIQTKLPKAYGVLDVWNDLKHAICSRVLALSLLFARADFDDPKGHWAKLDFMTKTYNDKLKSESKDFKVTCLQLLGCFKPSWFAWKTCARTKGVMQNEATGRKVKPAIYNQVLYMKWTLVINYAVVATLLAHTRPIHVSSRIACFPGWQRLVNVRDLLSSLTLSKTRRLH